MLGNFLPTWVLLLAILPQAAEKPLPDQATFLEEFRKALRTPDKLLSQYTYTMTETESNVDSKGKIKSMETNVYHVIHGAEEWQTYERKISKNGVPLPGTELEKQDRKERERVDKETRRRAKWSEAKRQQEKAEAERKERETADDIFASFDYQIARRDVLNGVPAILVNFKPKKSYKPKTTDAKQLQHAAGRLWIAEDDHQLVKLEAEVIETLKIGAGLLANVQKGSTLRFELQKINGEIWLPVKAELAANGRLLLLKGWNVHVTVDFSDHRKFNVDTILSFPNP